MTHQTAISASSVPVASLDRSDLAAAMAAVDLSIDPRNPMPILTNARLLSDCGRLVIVGTDLDMTITVKVAGDVDGRIETALPSRSLLQILQRAPKSERIDIALLPDPDMPAGANRFQSDRARISVGGIDYEIASQLPSEFPEVAHDLRKSVTFTLPGSVLWNAIDAVQPAISTEETRYYLNGVYLHYSDQLKMLRAVATDGHRLYSQAMLAPPQVRAMPAVILPRKAMDILHILMKGRSCPPAIDVDVAERAARFSFGNIDIVTRTVDGTFPDYGRVIPTSNDKLAVFNSAVLSKAIAAVMVVASDRGRAVRMNFDAGSCTLTISNQDTASAQTEIACDYEGNPIEIGFNASNLLEAIAAACPAGGAVSLAMSDPGSAAVLTGAMESWLAVQMPMRV